MDKRSKSFLLKGGFALTCAETDDGKPTVTATYNGDSKDDPVIINVTENHDGSTAIRSATASSWGSQKAIASNESTQLPNGTVSRADKNGRSVVGDDVGKTDVIIANKLKARCNEREPPKRFKITEIPGM
jgi:hypothetical protein